MEFVNYNKDDHRWERVKDHSWCQEVPNPFMQILYIYSDKIPSLKNIDLAIETGTYEGFTAEIFSNHFKKVYTTEKYTDNNSYNSNTKLQDIYEKLTILHPNIAFHTGDSVPFLNDILAKNNSDQFVILLDAHTYDHSPVIQELESIRSNSKRNDHIILIDDCIDLGSKGWPTRDEFEESIKKINTEYVIDYTQYGRGVVIIYPK